VQFHGLNPIVVLEARPEFTISLSSTPQFSIALAHFQPKLSICFRCLHLSCSQFTPSEFEHLPLDWKSTILFKRRL